MYFDELYNIDEFIDACESMTIAEEGYNIDSIKEYMKNRSLFKQKMKEAKAYAKAGDVKNTELKLNEAITFIEDVRRDFNDKRKESTLSSTIISQVVVILGIFVANFLTFYGISIATKPGIEEMKRLGDQFRMVNQVLHMQFTIIPAIKNSIKNKGLHHSDFNAIANQIDDLFDGLIKSYKRTANNTRILATIKAKILNKSSEISEPEEPAGESMIFDDYYDGEYSFLNDVFN